MCILCTLRTGDSDKYSDKTTCRDDDELRGDRTARRRPTVGECAPRPRGTLTLYTWLVYRFHQVPEMHVNGSVENALNRRARTPPSRALRPPAGGSWPCAVDSRSQHPPDEITWRTRQNAELQGQWKRADNGL